MNKCNETNNQNFDNNNDVMPIPFPGVPVQGVLRFTKRER